MTRTIRVARHEAAHAVVAWYFGHSVRRVVIADRDRGWCELVQRGKDPLARAMISYAGTAAEIRWHRLGRSRIDLGDHKKIMRLGFRGDSLSIIAQSTRNLVDHLAHIIEAVAQELKRRDLTGREVYRIARTAMGGT